MSSAPGTTSINPRRARASPYRWAPSLSPRSSSRQSTLSSSSRPRRWNGSRVAATQRPATMTYGTRSPRRSPPRRGRARCGRRTTWPSRAWSPSTRTRNSNETPWRTPTLTPRATESNGDWIDPPWCPARGDRYGPSSGRGARETATRGTRRGRAGSTSSGGRSSAACTIQRLTFTERAKRAAVTAHALKNRAPPSIQTRRSWRRYATWASSPPSRGYNRYPGTRRNGKGRTTLSFWTSSPALTSTPPSRLTRPRRPRSGSRTMTGRISPPGPAC